MSFHLEYSMLEKYLSQTGYIINKKIPIQGDPLIKQFEYWYNDQKRDVYLIELLHTNHAFMFKIVAL